MPTPNPDEDHDTFIARCMEDDEAVEDFPDDDQRLAFCESVWKQSQESDMEDFERRVSGRVGVETRADGSGRRLVGHAAVFDSLSGDLGGFREQIRAGAFSNSLQGNPDIRALWNHNDGQVLGRTRAGTLQLTEDAEGLRAEIDLPDTQAGRDAVTSVERGDVSQMSFAFRVRPGGQSFDENEQGEIIRTLTDVELFEVSPVTFPAYEATKVDARAIRHCKSESEEAGIHIPDTGSVDRMRSIRDSVVAKSRKGADWCEFRNVENQDESVEILIYDAIGLSGTEPREFVRKLGELQGRNVRLRINSPGGSVFDGAAIYNALRQHDGFVQVDIDGIAASMAGIIAMAGKRVRMNQNAFFMAHNASACVMGDAKAMRHEAELLEKINRSLAKTLAIRSGKDHAEIIAMMDKETWLDADEAKEIGFADEILHENGASIRHHDLSHFRNIPDKLLERRRMQWRRSRMSKKAEMRERLSK